MTVKPKAENRALADPETSSHIPIHALYTPADLDARNQEREVGYPGDYPFTRGVQATMYRGRLWTMRQYAGMGDAEESNKRYKYLLANGTTGLSIAFDLPTQIGLDSDHPLAVGEVGKVGVAIDSIEDMQRLFDGIDLTKISTSMTINATASILLALYVAVARRQGADVRLLSGTVQNDVPESRRTSAPWRRATATYSASRIDAVALMVIEVEIFVRSMPSKRRCMSSTESMATPTFPTSPTARGWSESRPI